MVIEVKPLQYIKQSVTNDVSYLFATLYSICYLAFFSKSIIPTLLLKVVLKKHHSKHDSLLLHCE